MIKNEKKPINKWQSPANQLNSIDENSYNIGIPTGRTNNIIVIDVDPKKEHKKELDGIAKVNEYLNQHGK